MIADDVRQFIARRFKTELLKAAVIHDGSAPGPRLLRCAVVASGGSMERLRMEVETLKHDYRDVIVEGEYIPEEGKLLKVRNLDEPISDET